MLKLTFLGTSGDSSVTAKQIRASGGIILQVNELQFHIDPGPGALVRAKEFQINPRATTAILVSHNHLNHVNDLNAVIDAMTLGGFDKKGILISNQTVVNNALSEFHRSCLERIITLSPSQTIGIEDVEIQAVPVYHTEAAAIGFKIICPTVTIGYTGDTGFNEALCEALKDSGILIINMTYPENTPTQTHLNRDTAIRLIESIRPQLAILTHFGFNMLKADPIMNARFMQIKTGIATVAAHDGLVITPTSYMEPKPKRIIPKEPQRLRDEV